MASTNAPTSTALSTAMMTTKSPMPTRGVPRLLCLLGHPAELADRVMGSCRRSTLRRPPMRRRGVRSFGTLLSCRNTNQVPVHR